ncbi:MAG: CvpA family protein [Paludibacteraceae bacterium]|nr:CvpA family protein [Paludibacteraceae bacterium]
MIALDIILLAILVFAIIRGLMKGFVMEIASLVGIVIGLFIARNFGQDLVGWLVSATGLQVEINNIVSFVIVFVLAMILVRFAAILIAKILKFAMLGWLDKLLGGIASLIKCLLVMSVLIYSFDKVNNYLHIVSQETIAQSKLYEPVKSLAYIVFPNESSNVDLDTNMPAENS